MIARKWYLLGALGAVLSACGGDSSTPGGNNAGCESAAAPATCGDTCSGDTGCGNGTYCGTDNTCKADCTADGKECAADQTCNAEGRCVPVGSNPDAGKPPDRPDSAPPDCPSVQANAQPIIPTVQLLIDHSGSMNVDFGGVPRIDAVREGLLDEQNGVVPKLQAQVKFGATLYTGDDGRAPCPDLTTVAPALNNYQTLNDELADLLTVPEIGEDTPTGESITAVANAFPPAGPNEKRIIVLATDGEPDSCAIPDPRNNQEQQQTRNVSEQAVQAAYAQGIDVFVLSVGQEVAEGHLQRMANAGVGKPFDEIADPAPFYLANNTEQLVDAFNQIIRGARECRFTLDGTVTKPEVGVVELNGNKLDYQTDWNMTDGTTLELLGDACQTYLTADVAELEAEFPCDAIIIVE